MNESVNETSWIKFPPALIKKLLELRAQGIREDVTLRFVDFDGTLMNDQVRYAVDPNLRQYSGDEAIWYIMGRYSTPDDPSGFKNFVASLEPRKHIFKNIGDFFNPENPYDFILTAGNIFFQKEKVDASWFPSSTKKLLVYNAKEKPLVMFYTCLKLGFIPGKIEFYDDRIKNFEGVDIAMSEALGIPVDFFQAIPNNSENIVAIKKVVQDKVATL